MGRRSARNRKPDVETMEQRTLLTAIIDIMAANHNALISSPRVQRLLDSVSNPSAAATATTSTQSTTSATTATSSPAATSARSRFTPTTKSIAVPENQGFTSPANPGYNLVIQPTGTATSAEVKKQLFKAVYSGPYTITPGAFSSQAMLVNIRGAGTNTTMLHSDIQIRLAVPTDTSLETTGASAIFDRNINSNSVLGLDLATPITNVDSGGRPNVITSVTLDPNSSSGTYDEGFAQGVMDIHYYPSGKTSRGIQQGTAVIKIYAQIYSPNVDNVLRNTDINP